MINEKPATVDHTTKSKKRKLPSWMMGTNGSFAASKGQYESMRMAFLSEFYSNW